MIKEAIGTGQTIEQAKEDAINQLGLSAEDEYQIEIIELPHKKTLGIFGGSPAKVRVYIDNGETESIDAFDVKEEFKAVVMDDDENKSDIKADIKKDPAYSEDEADKASEYVKSILESLGVENCQVDVKPDEEAMRIILSGDNISLAIGRRGETLDALQYLCSVVVNHNRSKFLRVVLDTGNYREKREKTLENLAKNMAAKAKRTGRNQMLEPMNPYERRIIHTAVQTIDGISSWSVGEGGNRRVIIGRKRGESSANRGYGRNGSSQKEKTAKKEFESKNDLDSAPLYGRIDK
ncbi:MAG TPA: protein jag [Firmicutes bacterium]|nr:protein jag [Bacillota bacterium]